MTALDTSPGAARIQEQAYRDLGSQGRFKVATELSDLVHEFAKAGIRRRHPGYTAEQVLETLATVLYRRFPKS
jgi:hypothetical protein